MLIDQRDKVVCYVNDETSIEDIEAHLEDMISDGSYKMNEAHSCKVSHNSETQIQIYGDEDYLILDLITIEPLM